jgi:hypothetical protein
MSIGAADFPQQLEKPDIEPCGWCFTFPTNNCMGFCDKMQ